jgi:hypothetical protein
MTTADRLYREVLLETGDTDLASEAALTIEQAELEIELESAEQRGA